MFKILFEKYTKMSFDVWAISRYDNITIARPACGTKRTARAAQLTDPDPHLYCELSCNVDLAEPFSEGESDGSEN